VQNLPSGQQQALLREGGVNLSEAAKLARPPFTKRQIRLIGRQQVDTAIAMLNNAPLDAVKPLLLTLAEEAKVRTLDQNAAYHAGPLRDIAEQAWIDGRQFSAPVLHEHFKQEYLPDDELLDIDEMARLVKEPHAYRKWDTDLRGNRICIGSTTQLTKFGFGEFMEQVQAFGAGLGVQFSAVPGR
jgi:hypothetical protein